MTTLDYIVNLFKEINDKINSSGTFIWNTRTLAAVQYELPTPQIHLYPIRINPSIYGASTVQVNIVMAFWEQDIEDSTPDYKQDKISEMETLANSWLAEIEERNQVEIIEGSVTLEPQEKAITGRFIGYAAQFNLRIPAPC